MINAVTAYDISALMILAVSGAYFIRTNPSRTSRYNIFVNIMFLGIVAGIADINRILLARAGLITSMQWRVANIVYLAAVSISAPFFYLYICGITDTWHLMKKRFLHVALVAISLLTSITILGMGLFNDVVVRFDEDMNIEYAWGYYFVYICIFICLFETFALVSFLKQFISKKLSFDLAIPICVVLLGLFVQMFIPEQHVIAFAVSVNVLLLVLINRRAEESLDVTTGMHSYWMFAKDMELKMKTGKEMKLILINIVNYEQIVRMTGYDNVLEMMRPLSGEIRRALRNNRVGTNCYYNGNGKFAVELNKKQYSDVHEIASEIIKSINENLKLEVSDFVIRINACIVNCPEDVSDIDSLFMLVSDMDLLNEDKKVKLASQITSTNEFKMKKDMATILDRAINNHYFSVFYQPIYNTHTKRFASAEALIRLRDPKYGYISPGLFIPLAEKSGAIHKIGSFVIDEVCKFIASDEFKALGVDYIEINLSVMQCLRTDLAEEIIRKANYYGIDHRKLNLEITETASAYSQEKIHGNVMALNKEGFTFSLDDFGTGYSNLMRVTSLPFSIIKLDRSFVLLGEKPGHNEIIGNIIKMIKEMEMDVLVEGVETKEMMEQFTHLGVDEIQGFYFSRPLTKSDYIRFLKKHLAGELTFN